MLRSANIAMQRRDFVSVARPYCLMEHKLFADLVDGIGSLTRGVRIGHYFITLLPTAKVSMAQTAPIPQPDSFGHATDGSTNRE